MDMLVATTGFPDQFNRMTITRLPEGGQSRLVVAGGSSAAMLIVLGMADFK
jgi:hypothetical protein